MDDTKKRPILDEILFLLGVIPVTVGAGFLQFAAREYEGDYSGFITSGSVYRFNTVFYVLGLLVFLAVTVLSYCLFLRKRLDGAGTILKDQLALFIVIAFIFSLLLFAALFAVCFLMMGISIKMKPEWMNSFTVFGWPIILFIFMVAVGVIHSRTNE